MAGHVLMTHTEPCPPGARLSRGFRTNRGDQWFEVPPGPGVSGPGGVLDPGAYASGSLTVSVWFVAEPLAVGSGVTIGLWEDGCMHAALRVVGRRVYPVVGWLLSGPPWRHDEEWLAAGGLAPFGRPCCLSVTVASAGGGLAAGVMLNGAELGVPRGLPCPPARAAGTWLRVGAAPSAFPGSEPVWKASAFLVEDAATSLDTHMRRYNGGRGCVGELGAAAALWLRFDEAGGHVARDSSGGGRDAAAVNYGDAEAFGVFP